MLALIEPSAGGDGHYYLRAARSLTFDMYRPPLYSLLLAPFINLGGLVFFVQSLLTVGAALLAYRLTGKFLAGALIATCPFFIVYEFSILGEALLVALLVSAWLLLDQGKAIWAGVLMGLAILTRDTFVLLPIFALPFGYWLGRTKSFLAFAAAAYLTVLPWPIYNLVERGQFALSEGRLGYNLWVGTWERNGDWMRPSIRNADYPAYAFTSPEQRRVLATPVRDDKAFKQAAIERIRTEPEFVLSSWVIRYPRLWLGTRTDQAVVRIEQGSLGWTAFKSAMWGLNLLVIIAGLVGLVLSRKWMLAIPVAYVAAVYVPFHNIEPRYSLPAIPFLLIFAAELWNIRQGQPRPWRSRSRADPAHRLP